MTGDDISNIIFNIFRVLYGVLEIVFWWIIGMFRAIIPPGVLPKKNLRNDVVLITGSGGGLGRQLALRFAQRGSKLILWDLNEKMNNETKKLVEAEGAEAHTMLVDLADRHAIVRSAKEAIKIYGRIDVLVNNAGIVNNKNFLDCSDEMMEKTIAVNCSALLYLTKALAPGMIERDHGHVVFIASMAGKVGVKGLGDYCASKFGAVGFSESLWAEFRNRSKNLHVTLVCPYYINTAMFNGVKSSSPLVLPILSVDYVADRTIDAIETNTGALYLPRFCYFTMVLKELLPPTAGAKIAKLVGIDKELNQFFCSK